MEKIATPLPGLFVLSPRVFEDSRGYFFEAYNQKSFTAIDIPLQFVQDNQSSSSYGVIRGLHYQLPPDAQTKLVRVLQGRILDVVLDIRKGSPSFGQHFSIELSAENKKQLLVPKGFAHGFSVLSENALVLYKCDAFYSKDCDAGIRFDDAALGIDWKIPAEKVLVSDKDRELPDFANCRNSFEF